MVQPNFNLILVRHIALFNPLLLLRWIMVRLTLLQCQVSGRIIVAIIGNGLDVVAEDALIGIHIQVRVFLHMLWEIAIISYRHGH